MKNHKCKKLVRVKRKIDALFAGQLTKDNPVFIDLQFTHHLINNKSIASNKQHLSYFLIFNLKYTL